MYGGEYYGTKTHISITYYYYINVHMCTAGNFEESVLNGRLEPVSTVEGFTAEIGNE